MLHNLWKRRNLDFREIGSHLEGPRTTIILPHVIPSYNGQPVPFICALKGRLGERIFSALNLCSVNMRLVLGPEKVQCCDIVKALRHDHMELLADSHLAQGRGRSRRDFPSGR